MQIVISYKHFMLHVMHDFKDIIDITKHQLKQKDRFNNL